MKTMPKVTPRNTALLVATFATCVTVALSVAVTSEAEGTSPTVVSTTAPVTPTQSIAGTITTAISDALTGAEPSTTSIPLTNAFQPTTPWPVVTTVSQTVLQAPHNLLTYSGVEAATRQMLGVEFSTWRAQFGTNAETKILPQGLLYSSGCVANCDSQKSLLFVNPANQRVYAAMVSGGKLSMWPSLMSWPDESIPTLKSWLADATDEQ